MLSRSSFPASVADQPRDVARSSFKSVGSDAREEMPVSLVERPHRLLQLPDDVNLLRALGLAGAARHAIPPPGSDSRRTPSAPLP